MSYLIMLHGTMVHLDMTNISFVKIGYVSEDIIKKWLQDTLKNITRDQLISVWLNYVLFRALTIFV